MPLDVGTEGKLCTAFSSFKSLLAFIYELIKVFIYKVSGKSAVSQTTAINRRHSKNALTISQDGNSNLRKRLKEVREMPGPKRLPFFGTLLTSRGLNSTDLVNVNEEREKLYGPLVKEEHFWNIPLVMVLGTEEVQKVVALNPLMRPGMEILINYRLRRPDRYNTFGLVNSQGETWKRLHSLFSAVTTSMNFVRSLLPVYNDIVCDTVNMLAEHTAGPTTVLPQILNKLIAETSFYNVFGKRMGFIGNTSEMTDSMKLFANCHDIYWHAFHKSMYGFPWWKYFPTKIWKDFIAAEDKMVDVISEISESMLANNTAGGILAAVQKDGLLKQDMNVALMELVHGATEPVYHATLIALYWICKHEHVQEKILEELRDQLPKKDSVVDEHVLDNIPYLKACVQETFRICPAACNVARILENECEVGGYRLPAYTVVIVQTWHACLKDTNFYRAKEFLPERWILDEDRVAPYSPHNRKVMNNFGIGTRACLGRKIAAQLIYTFLCKILRRYKVTFPKDIDLRYEWLLVVKDPVTVELKEYDF